jgi:hypothetical protein
MSLNPEERPSCSEMLKKKDSWAFSEKNLDLIKPFHSSKFEWFETLQNKGASFLYTFIQNKLTNVNFESVDNSILKKRKYEMIRIVKKELFNKKIQEMCSKLELDQKFYYLLMQHPTFCNYIKEVKVRS